MKFTYGFWKGWKSNPCWQKFHPTCRQRDTYVIVYLGGRPPGKRVRTTNGRPSLRIGEVWPDTLAKAGQANAYNLPVL